MGNQLIAEEMHLEKERFEEKIRGGKTDRTKIDFSANAILSRSVLWLRSYALE